LRDGDRFFYRNIFPHYQIKKLERTTLADIIRRNTSIGREIQPQPEDLDRLFAKSALDFLIVEADGAHGRPLKAPADHEPVVPSSSTTVVIALGVDAVGMRLDEASHRVERATAFSGLGPDHLLTAADCAAILVHPSGALRTVPEAARVFVAITKVSSPDRQEAAKRIAGRVVEHPRVDEAILIPEQP
jgi:probable selenium-dependent hydroxylase accessory protein YqeC